MKNYKNKSVSGTKVDMLTDSSNAALNSCSKKNQIFVNAASVIWRVFFHISGSILPLIIYLNSAVFPALFDFKFDGKM